MKNTQEIKINGCSVFWEMEQVKEDAYTLDAGGIVDEVLEWGEDVIKQAARPLVDILGVLHKATKSMSQAPDELELTMQLELALNGETPVFKILSVGTNCQIAAKFVWKKE